jgi:hypothetical protein
VASRDEAQRVHLNLRMREALRKRIARDAKRRGISLNTAIVERLEQSLEGERALAEAVELTYGAPHLKPLFQMMGAVAGQIEKKTGKKCDEDLRTYSAARAAWRKVIDQVWFDTSVGLPPELTNKAHGLLQGLLRKADSEPSEHPLDELRDLKTDAAGMKTVLDAIRREIEAGEKLGEAAAAQELEDSEPPEK